MFRNSLGFEDIGKEANWPKHVLRRAGKMKNRGSYQLCAVSHTWFPVTWLAKTVTPLKWSLTNHISNENHLLRSAVIHTYSLLDESNIFQVRFNLLYTNDSSEEMKYSSKDRAYVRPYKENTFFPDIISLLSHARPHNNSLSLLLLHLVQSCNCYVLLYPELPGPPIAGVLAG